MSFFGWVDYAEDDRRRMADVIDLFSERGTRDELGIAVIRDGIADLLFPGTGALQTRARYFFFVPWMYQRLERANVSPAEIGGKARNEELKLVRVLQQTGDEGVIGTRAKEKLQRLPSSIYWTGLEAWGLRKPNVTQAQYHRGVGRSRAALRLERVDDDKNPIGGAGGFWHAKLPAPPDTLPKEASFVLRTDEAEFLTHQITSIKPTPVLAHLVSIGESADAPFVWAHPSLEGFTPTHREQVEHARRFSELMHGPALLYNLMLAEKRGHEEWTARYGAEFADWAARFETSRAGFARWDRAAFWRWLERPSRVFERARRFVEAWATLISSCAAHSLATRSESRTLIQDRERAIKLGLARLENKRALERWQGASGARQLAFRWGQVQTIVKDIVRGREERA